MNSLFVLPFDHRGSFKKMLFPNTDELTDEQHNIIKAYKRVIFDALKVIGEKRGYDDLAVLIDEQYGKEMHQECKAIGLRNILTIEKSGQTIFDFQYDDWKDHILEIRPSYAKALIRVKIGDDNTIQNSRLKELGDFCTSENIGYLIEPLIQPSDGDMESVGNDKGRYDAEIRPGRFAEAVKELHSAGVSPDVWKIEGTETKNGMDICSAAVFQGGKTDLQIVILGRGASKEKVAHWLRVGANSKGVTGFAVGRTVFADTIVALHTGDISRDKAVEQIAENYQFFINVFENAKV